MMRFWRVSLHNYSSTLRTAIYFAVFIYRLCKINLYLALAYRTFNLFHRLSIKPRQSRMNLNTPFFLSVGAASLGIVISNPCKL